MTTTMGRIGPCAKEHVYQHGPHAVPDGAGNPADRPRDCRLVRWIEVPRRLHGRRRLVSARTDGHLRISRAAAAEVVARRRREYRQAPRARKGEILADLTATNGYGRGHLAELLARGPRRHGERAGRPGRRRTYGPDADRALKAAWQASGRLGAALLLGAIRGDLLDQMGEAAAPDTRAALLAMSEATIGRRISVFRREDRGYAAAPRSRRARSAIVAETEVSPSWRERAARPGFVQADAVVFRDDRAASKYLCALVAIDRFSGFTWLEALGAHTGGEVAAAVRRMTARSPFAWVEFHSDNGSEFMSRKVRDVCAELGVERRRGRPGRSNDQAHVEQRNRTAVREALGGGFYRGGAARAALARFCELQEAYLNFVRPIRKVARTVRSGARVTRVWDEARTPWRRLLTRPGLGTSARAALAVGAARIDALALQRELDEAKSAFWELEQPR